MNISLKINKLGSLENATIELKPFTIFFGKQATFKSYTLISVYGFFKMLEDVFSTGIKKESSFFSIFLRLINYGEKDEETEYSLLDGKTEKVKAKKLIFNVSDLIQAIKKLYKIYLNRFFHYMLNYIPEHDIDLEISYDEEIQEIWIYRIGETIQFRLAIKYKNGKVKELAEYSYSSNFQIEFSDKEADEFVIKEGLMEVFKKHILKKDYFDLDFLSPNRIDIVDVEKIITRYFLEVSKIVTLSSGSLLGSILGYKPAELTFSLKEILSIPGIIKETLDVLNRYNPTGKIFAIPKNDGFENLKENLYNLLDKGNLEFRKTNIGTNELFYITKEGKEIPIHATATSIKQLSLLYLALKYGNSTDKKILFIEEPEMNLHPELQMKLASLFSKIVSHEGWVFLTTHSDYFIFTLNSLIRIKYLEQKNDKVKKKLEELDLSLEEIPDIDKFGVYLFKKEKDKVFVERIKVSKEEGIPTDSFKKTLDKLYELIELSYGEF